MFFWWSWLSVISFYLFKNEKGGEVFFFFLWLCKIKIICFGLVWFCVWVNKLVCIFLMCIFVRGKWFLFNIVFVWIIKMFLMFFDYCWMVVFNCFLVVKFLSLIICICWRVDNLYEYCVVVIIFEFLKENNCRIIGVSCN